MTLLHALFLGALQGFTEFLPISSSGHLVLAEHYLNLPLSASVLQSFDIVLHAGTLLAILLYFRSTWIAACRSPFTSAPDGSPPLLLLLCIGTIPVGLAGLLGSEWIGHSARTPTFVSIAFLITGAALLGSSIYEMHNPGTKRCAWKQMIAMSIGQACAILPGVSRSGMTLATGRFAGLEVVRATEMAFLLGAPALGAALVYTLTTSTPDLLVIGWPQLLIGFSASLLSGMVVIHAFLFLVRNIGVWIWSIYLFIIGLLVLGDELLHYIAQIQEIGDQLPLPALLAILFVALLLEAIPVTSPIAPGLTTMLALSVLLSGSWEKILVCIPIGSLAMVIGNAIGYLPARQARLRIQWKEKSGKKLEKTQRFFDRWGVYAVFFGGWFGPFRAFISIAAGLGNMNPNRYFTVMILGALVWVSAVMGGMALMGGVMELPA